MDCQESKMSPSPATTKKPKRRGIGHTERGFRTSPKAVVGGSKNVVKPPSHSHTSQTTSLPQSQSLPELGENGNLMPFEVFSRRTSSNPRAKRNIVASSVNHNNNNTIIILYAYATQRGYYPDGTCVHFARHPFCFFLFIFNDTHTYIPIHPIFISFHLSVVISNRGIRTVLCCANAMLYDIIVLWLCT